MATPKARSRMMDSRVTRCGLFAFVPGATGHSTGTQCAICLRSVLLPLVTSHLSLHRTDDPIVKANLTAHCATECTHLSLSQHDTRFRCVRRRYEFSCTWFVLWCASQLPLRFLLLVLPLRPRHQLRPQNATVEGLIRRIHMVCTRAQI